MSTTKIVRNVPITEDPARTGTLPGWVYTDPAFFAREAEEIHFRSWHYAGCLDELQEPGDYVTASILDQSVIVIRDKNGELGGFYNVCQHRAHELLRGRGKARIITCPYHAWSYGTDGHFRGARGTQYLADFDARDYALKPVRIELFADRLVFFNLDLAATPLADQAGGLAAEIKNEVIGLDRMVVQPGTPSGTMNANWKVAVDNYLECYHCSIAHPVLSDLLDMKSHFIKTERIWMGQRIDLKTNRKIAYPVAEDAEVRQGRFWWLWPTTTLNVLPGSPDFSVYSFMPTGVGTTLQIGQCFSVPGQAPDVARNEYRNGVLTDEDVSLCESVQRGLASRGYSSGRLMFDPTAGEITEAAVHHFHRMVAEQMRL
jgi:choline monooxygenase